MSSKTLNITYLYEKIDGSYLLLVNRGEMGLANNKLID